MFDIENTDIYADAQTDQAQHERRMEEIMRRRLEKADGSDKMQKMRNFIRRTLTVFSQELPLSARAHFVQTIRQYLKRWTLRDRATCSNDLAACRRARCFAILTLR